MVGPPWLDHPAPILITVFHNPELGPAPIKRPKCLQLCTGVPLEFHLNSSGRLLEFPNGSELEILQICVLDAFSAIFGLGTGIPLGTQGECHILL